MVNQDQTNIYCGRPPFLYIKKTTPSPPPFIPVEWYHYFFLEKGPTVVSDALIYAQTLKQAILSVALTLQSI